jgi:hypothetical protein
MRKRNRDARDAASKVHARPIQSDLEGLRRALRRAPLSKHDAIFAAHRAYEAATSNQDMQSGQASPNQDGCGRCGGAYPCNGVLWGTHRFER